MPVAIDYLNCRFNECRSDRAFTSYQQIGSMDHLPDGSSDSTIQWIGMRGVICSVAHGEEDCPVSSLRQKKTGSNTLNLVYPEGKWILLFDNLYLNYLSIYTCKYQVIKCRTIIREIERNSGSNILH